MTILLQKMMITLKNIHFNSSHSINAWKNIDILARFECEKNQNQISLDWKGGFRLSKPPHMDRQNGLTICDFGTS